MGAALSTGIDIDPQAVASAHENMLLNGMDSNKMPVYLVPTGAEPSSFSSSIDRSQKKSASSDPELKSSRGTFDIVAANILLNPLLELVEDIVGYAKTGGTVAVSGILCEQVNEFDYFPKYNSQSVLFFLVMMLLISSTLIHFLY
jgi:ribosomal protein L11 methylase PrmA